MEYKKPSAAASVAVYAKKDNCFLVIRRLHEPFKHFYAFPGGFLDVDNEDLEHTAVRELSEEAGLYDVRPEQLHLIDVRSSPTRDPRGHVIDVGFLYIIDKKCAIPDKTDEAKPEWVSWDKLETSTFAFDHNLYWKRIKEFLSRKAGG